MTQVQSTPTPARVPCAALLAIVSALAWFAWIGGDLNPEPWQVLGVFVTGAVVVLAARSYLPPPMIVLAAPLGFTLACAVAVYPQDETGMSLIGIVLVGFASLVTVGAFVGLSGLIGSRKRPTAHS